MRNGLRGVERLGRCQRRKAYTFSGTQCVTSFIIYFSVSFAVSSHLEGFGQSYVNAFSALHELLEIAAADEPVELAMAQEKSAPATLAEIEERLRHLAI